ncbi:MAG: site-specific DNA-methyltransferase [Actinomycetia bacterium]|nr:site-specific DNA-methyltransferase [Actinomycetes bacterium]MCP4084133.1 site-specific DNA-methyltransferase [Actinomycetes bacterium]
MGEIDDLDPRNDRANDRADDSHVLIARPEVGQEGDRVVASHAEWTVAGSGLSQALVRVASVTETGPCSPAPGRGTSTSAFGAGKRESHDASEFYARFTPPEISASTDVRRLEVDLSASECHLGDSTNMTQLPDNSVALVVTSPPYFVGKEYELAVTSDSDHPDERVPTTYLDFLAMLRDVFCECVRVLEPGGRIAVNVANLGRKPYRSLSADVISILQDELGLLLRGEVIWQKGKTSSGSCAWGSFAKAGNPVLRDVTERVIIASKGRFDRAVSVAERKKAGLPHQSTIANDEFVDVTRDVWEIDAESATRIGHPAPFPIELPARLIDLYTYADDIVLDPFAGSGSTLVAATRRGRVGVGFDLEPEYVAMANDRIGSEKARRKRLADLAATVEQPAFEMQTETLAGLQPDERQEHFQARAVSEGKKAQHIAANRLGEAGFLPPVENPKIRQVGLQFNFQVTSPNGGEPWYVDVSGAFTSSRPGLLRTDTLWKTIGRVSVLKAHDSRARVIVLTSNLPRPGSEGDKALRAMGPRTVFDAIELYDPIGLERLRRYAEDGQATPIDGFWTPIILTDAGY